MLTMRYVAVVGLIMVLAGSEDKWFAVTGFEAEEE